MPPFLFLMPRGVRVIKGDALRHPRFHRHMIKEQLAALHTRTGVIVNPVGVVGAIEYEHLLGNRVSLGARLSYIDYDYKDGSCQETERSGRRVRCASTRAARGTRASTSAVRSAYGTQAGNTHDPASVPTRDSGTSTAINVNVNLGLKIPLGSDRVYIDPNIAIGNFFSTASDDAANLGFDIAGGVSGCHFSESVIVRGV